MKKKDMKFKQPKDLENVQKVIDEADLALKEKSRKIKDSVISEAIGGALGAGAGVGIGFLGLYLGGMTGLSAAGVVTGLATIGGIVGGGVAAGVALVAAPAVALTGVGVGVTSHIKNKNFYDAKTLAYKNCIAKQTAIIKALKEETDADKERIDYLNGLNILLQAAIKDLKHDLEID